MICILRLFYDQLEGQKLCKLLQRPYIIKAKPKFSYIGRSRSIFNDINFTKKFVNIIYLSLKIERYIPIQLNFGFALIIYGLRKSLHNFYLSNWLSGNLNIRIVDTWFSHNNSSSLINVCLDNALCSIKRKLGHYIVVQQKIISFTSTWKNHAYLTGCFWFIFVELS